MVGGCQPALMRCSTRLLIVFGAMALLMSYSPLQAQKPRTQMVLLKNGEMVKGVIRSSDPVAGVRIENSCGIRVIAPNEIDTIMAGKASSMHFTADKGFYNLSSLTLLFGEGENGFVPLPSLTTTFGYLFNDKFMAGAGLGIEYFNWPVMPLYAETRYIFRTNDILYPWVSLRAGGAIPLVNTYDGNGIYGWVSEGKTYGGLMINPETGIWFPLSSKTGVSVSVGYHHQRLSYDSSMIDWRFGTQIGTRRVYTYYNRINLRLGLYFK